MIFVPIRVYHSQNPTLFSDVDFFHYSGPQLSPLDMNKMTLSEYPVVIVGKALTDYQVEGH